ncbi:MULTISPECIES: hypothetical protein [unclassified Bradyrhizobium]|uniref:hypothetical protein n=1 Tax=unclassified Bradyrhizobium TaxID=2631580 RepID=UPI0028EB35F9|nr:MULTISPECIES: hypothetical protein [unclassified Bradyrhizobium]
MTSIGPRALFGILLSSLIAGCDLNPQLRPVPVPADQAAFQSAWNAGRSYSTLTNSSSYDGRVEEQMPRDLRNWTGKVLIKKTVRGKVELFVVQVADQVAVVAYNVDPALRADLADRDNYVQFSGVRPEHPSPTFHSDELQISGIWVLFEMRLDKVSVPNHRQGQGI